MSSSLPVSITTPSETHTGSRQPEAKAWLPQLRGLPSLRKGPQARLSLGRLRNNAAVHLRRALAGLCQHFAEAVGGCPIIETPSYFVLGVFAESIDATGLCFAVGCVRVALVRSASAATLCRLVLRSSAGPARRSQRFSRRLRQ